MIFKIPYPSIFFTQYGIVATLRDYPYEKKIGKVITVTLIGGKKVRAKVIEVIKQPSYADLEEYVDISGFETVDDWLNTAVMLHKKMPTRLVVLKMEKGGKSTTFSPFTGSPPPPQGLSSHPPNPQKVRRLKNEKYI